LSKAQEELREEARQKGDKVWRFEGVEKIVEYDAYGGRITTECEELRARLREMATQLDASQGYTRAVENDRDRPKNEKRNLESLLRDKQTECTRHLSHKYSRQSPRVDNKPAQVSEARRKRLSQERTSMSQYATAGKVEVVRADRLLCRQITSSTT
jgi:hypothetical protein